MSTPSDHAIKAFLINLENAVARREHCVAEFEAAGLPYAIVNAVNGYELTLPHPDYDEQAYHRQHGGETSFGLVGGYLSHLQAMRHFLASDADYGLICEDDIALGDGFCDLLQRAISHADRWDLLRLSGRRHGTPVVVVSLDQTHSLAVNMTRQTGAGAYLVNRHAAERMTARMLPMTLPFDHAFDQEWRFGCRALSLIPFPVGQQEELFASQNEWSRKLKRGPSRYLTVFPHRAANEVSRVCVRSWQVVREKLRRAA